MRRWATLVGATVVFLSLAITPSKSSCAPPIIAFEEAQDRITEVVSPGDSVSLIGKHWTSDCFDTGPIGACERGPGDERPMHGIDVDLLRKGSTERVAEDLSAESDLTLSVVFQVPNLEPGRYRVLVHDRDAEGAPDLFLKIRE